MKFIDLSNNLNNKTKEFPGDPKLKINYFKIPNKEDSSNISKISSSLHTGTHMDAPFHYFLNGKNVSDFKLDSFIGKSSVLTLKNIENKEIFIEDLNFKNPLEEIVILKTSWCDNWNKDNYFYENPYLSNELAEFIIESNVKGLAIDTPSVDKLGENQIHKKLLKNNIWIVENLANTNKLIKNYYNAYFIPLNIKSEASFVRAFVEK